MSKTPEEETQEAREALAKYSPRYGTPAQIAAVQSALDAGARVLCVDAMGELSFLVFRPVPPNVEEALHTMIPVPPPRSWLDPGTRYVTDNPNWDRTPYWDVDFLNIEITVLDQGTDFLNLEITTLDRGA